MIDAMIDRESGVTIVTRCLVLAARWNNNNVLFGGVIEYLVPTATGVSCEAARRKGKPFFRRNSRGCGLFDRRITRSDDADVIVWHRQKLV